MSLPKGALLCTLVGCNGNQRLLLRPPLVGLAWKVEFRQPTNRFAFIFFFFFVGSWSAAGVGKTRKVKDLRIGVKHRPEECEEKVRNGHMVIVRVAVTDAKGNPVRGGVVGVGLWWGCEGCRAPSACPLQPSRACCVTSKNSTFHPPPFRVLHPTTSCLTRPFSQIPSATGFASDTEGHHTRWNRGYVYCNFVAEVRALAGTEPRRGGVG